MSAATLHKLRAAIQQHQFTTALILAVGLSLTLVAVSVGMYYSSGFHRFDLSRPGYEHERSEITRPTPSKTYDTISPVTPAAITSFLQEFDQHQQNLDAFGDFEESVLGDDDLRIAPAAQ